MFQGEGMLVVQAEEVEQPARPEPEEQYERHEKHELGSRLDPDIE